MKQILANLMNHGATWSISIHLFPNPSCTVVLQNIIFWIWGNLVTQTLTRNSINGTYYLPRINRRWRSLTKYHWLVEFMLRFRLICVQSKRTRYILPYVRICVHQFNQYASNTVITLMTITINSGLNIGNFKSIIMRISISFKPILFVHKL